MIVLLIALYLLIAIVGFARKKHNGLFLLFGIFLFLIAVFGSRHSVDYENYLKMFNIIDELTIHSIEPSFIFITNLIKFLFDNALFLFVVYALLGVFLTCKAIKNLSEFWFLSLLIYLSHFFLLQEMTQIRVGVACGFMLLAIKPVYERDFKRFLCYTLLAVLFHYSAILFFFLWFLPVHNISRKFYALLIPAAYLLYSFGISFVSLAELVSSPIPILKDRILSYRIYMEQENLPINVFNVVQLIRCAFVFLLLWKYPLLKQHNKYVPILLQLYVLSVVALVVFADLPIFAFRISELIGVVEIILIPCVYYLLRPKQVAVALISLLGFGTLLLNLFHNKLIIV